MLWPPSALELPQLVDVDRQAAAVDRDDEAEPDAHLAGGDDHDDDREDLPVDVAPHARERDERDVRRVQHELEAQQHDERVAAREHATGADAEHERRDDEVPVQVHRTGSPVPAGGPSSRCSGVPVRPSTASAIVPTPGGRRNAIALTRVSSSWMPPRRRARTTAPTAAMSSRYDATSNATRNFVRSAWPSCCGPPKPNETCGPSVPIASRPEPRTAMHSSTNSASAKPIARVRCPPPTGALKCVDSAAPT